MTDPFPQWTALLAQARKGPVSLPVAVRGQAYQHNISISGDWTLSTLTGSVRASPDSGSVLAAFTIGTPSLVGGLTVWPVSLSTAQTTALPVDADGDGVEYFPYDFLLNNQRLFGGIFPLSGHITEPA